MKYIVAPQVLDETRSFLYARGLEGCEGMGLWIGRVLGDRVRIARSFFPEQVCTKSEHGVAVDLTPRAHYTLPDALESGERFFVRVHSHPCRAYHSPRDNQNAVLTHQGALSVVVPNFAREPLDLTRCAIYRLEYGRGWIALSTTEIRNAFEVLS